MSVSSAFQSLLDELQTASASRTSELRAQLSELVQRGEAVITGKLRWSTEKPSVAGVYWYRTKRAGLFTTRTLLKVYEQDHQWFASHVNMQHTDLALDSYHQNEAEWAGPVSVPE
jgi:hypothetical protein